MIKYVNKEEMMRLAEQYVTCLYIQADFKAPKFLRGREIKVNKQTIQDMYNIMILGNMEIFTSEGPATLKLLEE